MQYAHALFYTIVPSLPPTDLLINSCPNIPSCLQRSNGMSCRGFTFSTLKRENTFCYLETELSVPYSSMQLLRDFLNTPYNAAKTWQQWPRLCETIRSHTSGNIVYFAGHIQWHIHLPFYLGGGYVCPEAMGYHTRLPSADWHHKCPNPVHPDWRYLISSPSAYQLNP